MAHVVEGGPCDEGGICDGAGRGVGGCGHRAGEGGMQWRGDIRRFSNSPPSLSSSALHCLLAAFLISLASGGEGSGKKPGECSGSEGVGRKGSGSECLGTNGLAVRTRAGEMGI